MSTSIQQVQTQGIYHGLPVFPEHQKGLTAIITGANGISGYYMLKVLAQAPERWTKIYCLSRRPPAIKGGLPRNAEHVALDFLKRPEEIGAVLKEKGIKADYVFFFSYIQPPPKEGKGLWSDADEMVRVNKLLLDNFLEALTLASITPKRFMLQTGAKNYGGHLGPTRVPQEESDPRIELEPNFYYAQEDSLFAWCATYAPPVHWTVTMPSFILGAISDAAMNAAYPLAVYAAVCAHLRRPLDFPGDIASWQMTQVASSATLNAYLAEWSVLTPAAADQRFNACDASAFAWEKCWPRVAGWYGVAWTGPMHVVDAAEGEAVAEYTEVKTPYEPLPRGYGPAGKVRFRYRMTEWARRPEVVQAWRKLAERHELVEKELRDIDRVFGFLDGMINRSAAVNFSTDKSRKMGWHGFVDSAECFLETFRDLAALKMIPPVPEIKVEFN